MPDRKCAHKNREPSGDVHARCLDCKAVFFPRGEIPDHGTVWGYNRHRRFRKGEWAWPACSPCQLASREWRQGYTARPDAAKSRKIRASARMAALIRMRRQYPAAYLEVYREELAVRSVNEVMQRYQVPVWEDILARLVKAATGRDEAFVESRLRLRMASREEAEVMRQVRRLRVILASREKPDEV